MEVNPCKKCGRPVSVHAEYCPYCGCVVDRRPFVPASTSKPLGGGSTPAPTAPVSRPVASSKPTAPSSTPTPIAAAAAETQSGNSAAVQNPTAAASVAPTVAPEVPPVPPTVTPPVAPPPAFDPSTYDDDEEPRRSGGGMKWALALLALIIVGCAVGGFYYYENYVSELESIPEQTPIAQPDTTPPAPAPVADNEAELREKVVNY